MKWDTLKRNVKMHAMHISWVAGAPIEVVAHLLAEVVSGHGLDEKVRARMDSKGLRFRSAVLDVCQDHIEEIIDKWDIRSVGRLRDLFPEAFPKNLRTGRIHAYINERGDWVVEPDAAPSIAHA